MKKAMPTASFMRSGTHRAFLYPLGRNRIAVIVPIELWEELTSENDIDATEELLSIAGFERGSPRRRRA